MSTCPADDLIFRYAAIRVRTPQGVLFEDGSTVKHFAVVTNDWAMEGQARLTWLRGKCGTIELVNDALKNELAAGVHLSDKFGANAAWRRLQVLTQNLLELLKATAPDPEYRKAGPKRLRFAIFTQFGRVVQHARTQFVRLTTRAIEALVRPGPGATARDRLGEPLTSAPDTSRLRRHEAGGRSFPSEPTRLSPRPQRLLPNAPDLMRSAGSGPPPSRDTHRSNQSTD